MAIIQQQDNILLSRARVEPNKTYKFKICLIGDGGVGKTTYINRVLNGAFERVYDATENAVVHNVQLGVGNGANINYEVWDTAGQEKKNRLGAGYYINAIGAFIFCDVTTRITINSLQKHIKEFVNACQVENPVIIICINKMDTLTNKKPIWLSPSALRDKTGGYDVQFVEMSAKTNLNYSVPWEKLSKTIFQDPNLTLAPIVSLENLPKDYDFFKTEEDVMEELQRAAAFKPEE